MSLRIDLLDALIDGELGRGLVVKREEVMNHFDTRKPSYTGVILSNAEMDATHSPTYTKFTIRINDGEYRIHPEILAIRMRERGIIT